jgi:hypothetical protein
LAEHGFAWIPQVQLDREIMGFFLAQSSPPLACKQHHSSA